MAVSERLDSALWRLCALKCEIYYAQCTGVFNVQCTAQCTVEYRRVKCRVGSTLQYRAHCTQQCTVQCVQRQLQLTRGREGVIPSGVRPAQPVTLTPGYSLLYITVSVRCSVHFSVKYSICMWVVEVFSEMQLYRLQRGFGKC